MKRRISDWAMKWSLLLDWCGNALAVAIVVGFIARLAWQVFRHADYTLAVWVMIGLWVVAWLLKQSGLRLHP